VIAEAEVHGERLAWEQIDASDPHAMARRLMLADLRSALAQYGQVLRRR
jgi:hypothetical protein